MPSKLVRPVLPRPLLCPPLLLPLPRCPAPVPSSKPRKDTAQPQAPTGPTNKQDTGTPAPPPLSQIVKRPVRASRSQAPPELPVEDINPAPPKKTRTAKHPCTNSKKIVERLQQEWSARVAALPAAFRGEGPPPPLSAAQVNSLREEQEIQVRSVLLYKFLNSLTVFVADGLVCSVHRTRHLILPVRGVRCPLRSLFSQPRRRPSLHLCGHPRGAFPPHFVLSRAW